ncbi:MAG: FHA domain-containing protein, partial [Bdellovibrionota bacterium]
RAGISFIIKDLESANGTYVNGVKVQEQELTGDDEIRIGGVTFQFKAQSAEYLAQEAHLVSPPAEELPDLGGDIALADPNSVPPMVPDPAQPDAPLAPMEPIAGVDPGQIPGITGISPSQSSNKSLIAKFRQLPKRTQAIGLVAIVLLLWYLSEDDPEPAHKKVPKKSAVAVSGPSGAKGVATFESLTPEQKRFVEAQHNLAFDYYRNRDYDKAIYEIAKVFTLVNDYKDSREIERYAKEGKRKLEALEDEKRRKEEEARLKAKIQTLVDECKSHMEKKEYEPARDLFTQILAIDPDNTVVAGWRKEIEEYEEKKRLEEQQKLVQGEINKRAWEVFKEGMILKKKGKYHTAIDAFGKIPDMGASDKKILPLARLEIARCRAAIKARRDPVLAEAKAAEGAGEFAKAFHLFKRATIIDPPHPEGYAGMARVRGILHDRAKGVYTEAVLAESYSDFAIAKKKYEECLQIAPVDDIYHDRATRKLARFFRKSEEPAQ